MSQSHSLRLAICRKSVRLGDMPLNTHGQIFVSQLNTCGHSLCVTSFLTRGWVFRLRLLLALASAVILRSESRGTHDHILLSQIVDSPNLEGQVRVFISPRNRLPRLNPQALGSFFVASCDSQGYDGGIRPRLHTESTLLILSSWDPRGVPTENTAFPVVACWFTVVEMGLPHSCVATSAARTPGDAACNASSIVAWRHRAPVCCGCNITTAAVYRVTAKQRAYTPEY
jgi:hypothetical protein